MLQNATKTIAIVFVAVSDPVGAGFIASLPRPGTNMTGFINLERTLGGKWLELLKEIAPGMTRVAVMFNPQTAPYTEELYLPSMETAAKNLGVKQLKSLVYRETDIEEAIAGLGREPGSGLIAMTDSFMTVHRKAVIELSIQNKLPLMYYVSVAPREGGLISYGIDLADLFGRSASYVDRILRGAKPAELPVQLPTKFEMTINLRTARALGLSVPSTLLTSANEVIE